MRRISQVRATISPRWIGRQKVLVTKPSRVDLWISRIASLSQTAVVLLTAAGFYFTVLPLYQKSLLEEAIAKKEIEFKEVTVALERAYGRVRHGATKEYIFYAGAKCSGLLLPPPALYLIGKSNPDKRPHAQQVLEIGAHDCFLDSLEKYRALDDLRPDDLKQFRDIVTKVAGKLDQRRSSLLAQSRSEWNSPLSSARAEEYSNFVRAEVESLRTIHWNNAQ